MNIVYRQAIGLDASELTAIAFAAKRHWDYPEEWIDLWASELTIDPLYITTNWVLLANTASRIVGWCAVSQERDEHWLDYCWVLPDAAGTGIGGTLVRRALGHAAALDARTLKVLSDPNAEGFYRRMGFETIGDQESRPEGRRLPLMQAIVADTA